MQAIFIVLAAAAIAAAMVMPSTSAPSPFSSSSSSAAAASGSLSVSILAGSASVGSVSDAINEAEEIHQVVDKEFDTIRTKLVNIVQETPVQGESVASSGKAKDDGNNTVNEVAGMPMEMDDADADNKITESLKKRKEKEKDLWNINASMIKVNTSVWKDVIENMDRLEDRVDDTIDRLIEKEKIIEDLQNERKQVEDVLEKNEEVDYISGKVVVNGSLVEKKRGVRVPFPPPPPSSSLPFFPL